MPNPVSADQTQTTTLSLKTRLYFLRHTHAEAHERDEARPLSQKGQAQAEQLAQFCRKAGVVFDAAYSSPLVRAKETAQAVLKITNRQFDIDLQLTEMLMNETSPSSFNTWVRDLPPARHVLLVGHNPSLTDRVRHLLGMPHPGSLDLPKGGMICLKAEHRQSRPLAELKFFITPKML